MKDLVSELTQARYQAAGGATVEARHHIAESMGIVRDVFGGCGAQPRAARAIRTYVSDAHHWILKGHSRRAVEALGSAIETIRDEAGGGVGSRS